ncbi:MAG: hypothetical protein ACHQQ3_13020, partial [Gemmatimonadales bacterium]
MPTPPTATRASASIAAAGHLLAATVLFAGGLGAQPDPHLIPKPREIAGGDVAPLSRSVGIEPGSIEDDRFTARDFADALTQRGLKATLGTGAAG